MHANSDSTIDQEAFTVRRRITIAAPIERVWAAITEAEHVARWFPQATTLNAVRAGATGTFFFEGEGTVSIQVEELDPPRMIAYRWASHDLGASSLTEHNSTVFRFTLEATENGTELTVVESGFGALADPLASMEDNRRGWNFELDELIEYLGAQR